MLAPILRGLRLSLQGSTEREIPRRRSTSDDIQAMPLRQLCDLYRGFARYAPLKV